MSQSPSDDVEQLENEGVWVLHPDDRAPLERTVIVLGVARSGTSMVAGALSHLGVWMGDSSGVFYEDVEVARLIETRQRSELLQLIRERDARYPLWGWKRPRALDYDDVWRGCFRNPHYVFVFRDIFAIANRNRISMMADVVANMEQALERYARLVGFLKGCGDPSLLVSYEKAMLDPAKFTARLSEFVGVTGPALLHGAQAFIAGDRREYLEAAAASTLSRITGSIGVIDIARPTEVVGWARYESGERPATVRIRAGSREWTITANLPRPDVRDKALHPDGRCGFKLKLRGSELLDVGETVTARVVGDLRDLRNSPMAVSP